MGTRVVGVARIDGMGQMVAHERRLVLEQLASSEARLLELVEGLCPEQWGFRETRSDGRLRRISSIALCSRGSSWG